MRKKEKILKKIFIFQIFFHFAENLFMKNMKNKIFMAVIAAAALITLSSCATTSKSKVKPKEPRLLSRRIMDQGQLTADQLAAYFLSRNQSEDAEHIREFAQYYIDEAAAEGVNSDVAFAQMCLETGYLRFGGLVQPEFHNYCGLGAMDAEHPGEQFETEQLGVRAHIQHLQAYGTNEETQLNNELIDPRYNWVHKTKFVEDIYGLAGTWAADPLYGQKLETVLTNMGYF